MASESTSSTSPWTVADAKAQLSHILRCAEEEGPQRIGRHRTYVIVPERLWEACSSSEVSLGRWLVENMPRSYELDLPSRHSDRGTPFADRNHG